MKNLDILSSFVDEMLDVARENPLDDARIIIRDRIEKDIIKPLEKELLRVYRERDQAKQVIEHLKSLHSELTDCGVLK